MPRLAPVMTTSFLDAALRAAIVINRQSREKESIRCWQRKQTGFDSCNSLGPQSSTTQSRQRQVRWSAMHEDFVRARLVLVKPALAYYMFMNEGRSILSIGIASSINHFRIGIRESLLTSLPIQNKNFQNLETGVFYKNRFGYLGFAATGLIHRNVNAMDVQGNEFPFLSQEKSLALSGGISTNELSNVFLIRPSFSIARVGLSIRPTAVIARTEFNLEIEFYQQVNIGISHRNDLLDEIFSSSAQQIDFWLGYKNDKIKMMLLVNSNTSMEQFAAELMFGYRFWENEVIPLKNYHFF